MSTEVTQAAVIIGAGIVLRVWSMLEHKATSKKVENIYYIMNGEMEKKLNERYQQGLTDGQRHSEQER